MAIPSSVLGMLGICTTNQLTAAFGWAGGFALFVVNLMMLRGTYKTLLLLYKKLVTREHAE